MRTCVHAIVYLCIDTLLLLLLLLLCIFKLSQLVGQLH